MHFALPVIVFCLALWCPAAASESRSRLSAVRDWSLDEVDGLVIKDGTYTGVFDNMCVAWSEHGTVKLSLIMNSRHSGVPAEFAENVYFQLSSPSWKFKFREASLYLSSVEPFGAGNAWYFDDTISFNVTIDEDFGLSSFVEVAGGKFVSIEGDGTSREIENSMLVLDGDGVIIAEISTLGLKSIYYKLLDCSGQRP